MTGRFYKGKGWQRVTDKPPATAQKESQTGNRKTRHKSQTSAGIIRVQLKIGLNFIGFLIPHARDSK
jgi:hypothetical protein